MQIRILIIDDDDELLFLADRFIGGAGSDFDLIPVSNGQEALQKLEEEDIDAIVCDYDLGPNEMDGLEILEWIREADNQIPFIIFTGQSREEVAIRALNSGADYYLQKSADLKSAFNELSHHIENVVKHRKLELALEKSEESHRLLVHSLNDLIFVYDKDDYCIQYYAAKKEDLFLPPEQFMNRHVSEYMPSHLCQPYLEHSKKVRLSGDSEEFEYYFDMMEERRWFNTNLELHDDGESIISVVRSITEKRFTEHALKIAQFSIDCNTDPIIWIGPKAEIIYVNNATCRIFDFTQEEFLGMKITDIDPTFDDERWTLFWNDLKEKKSAVFESVMQTKSGKGHPVEISVNYAELEGKEYAFAYGRDISKHKQAKKALEDSEQRKDSILRVAPVGIGVVKNRAITWVSDTFSEMVGYSSEELIGKSARMVYETDEEYTRVGKEKYEQIKQHGTGSVVTQFKCKDGRVIHVDLRSTPLDLEDPSSEVTFTALDITDRVEAEGALIESRNQLRKTHVITKMGFLTWNLITNEIFWSDEVFQIFGVDPERIEPTSDYTMKLVHPEDLDDVQSSLDAAIKGIKEHDIDYRVIRPDGNILWVHAKAELTYDDSGVPTQLLGTIVDITERKDAQEALRSREEKLRGLFQKSPIGIELYDSKGHLIDANETILDMFGVSRIEDIKGFNIFEDPNISAEIKKKLEIGESVHLESEFDFEKVKERGLYPTSKSGLMCIDVMISILHFDNKIEDEVYLVHVQDITERKKGEVELQKLTRAVEFSPTCVVITDLDGKIEYVNPKFTEMTGYSSEEVLGQNPAMLQSGLTPPETYPELWAAIKAGKEWRGIFVNKKKNGEIYWEEAWLAPIKGVNDTITHIVAIKDDITVRRMMEEELENSEARWRCLVDETPMMILTINQESEVTFANQTVVSLIPDIVGTSVENYIQYIVKEDRDSSNTAIKEVFATQEPTGFKISLDIPGKGLAWFDVRVAPIKLQGDTTSIIAILADITDLATAQRVLRESEMKFRALYMDAPLAYHSLDDKGNLIEVNNTWLKTMGYKRSDVINKSFGDFLTPDSKDVFKIQFPTFKEKGKIDDALFDMIRCDDTIIPVTIDGVIASNSFGHFDHTHCIIQDISERVRTEQILKEHEQVLLNQKKELSDFVHSMSHDIGNSLSVIKGLAELIPKDYSPDVITRITQTVQMMRDLLDSSVTLADAGQVIGDKQVVSLGEIMDQVARAVIPDDIKYKRDELPLVSGDRQKIIQIFQNIIANAVIHGSPTVIEIKFEHSETGPTMIITNDGNPIPLKIQSRLFKGDIRSRKRGEGLGLIIVRKLVDAHGWEIDYMPDPQPAFRIHLDQIVE